jgi:hypothetical protein
VKKYSGQSNFVSVSYLRYFAYPVLCDRIKNVIFTCMDQRDIRLGERNGFLFLLQVTRPGFIRMQC